jgi:hypothetical protein
VAVTVAPSSGRGSALIAHQTTRQRYTTGIFRITIRNTTSQTESGATGGVYRRRRPA